MVSKNVVRASTPMVRSPWVWGSSALVVVGLVAWFYELEHGLAVTGMRDVVSWGLYIITFAFLIGLAAGGLVVSASAEVFHIEALRPLSRLGVLTAAIFSAAGGLMIIPDLGKPFRILNLFLYPNWTSPLEWDVTIITIYFLFSATELYYMVRHPDHKRLFKVLAYIALPLAVLLHSITAILFGLQFARVWWNIALLPPMFVASAIVSGTALIVVIAWILQKYHGVTIPSSTWRWLAGLMAVSLAIDLFFVGCDYVTILWDNIPTDRAVLALVLPGGRFQFTFWFEWVVGGLIPFVVLASSKLRSKIGYVVASAVLILVGVYAFRIELIVPGFINPLIQLPPGIALGTFTPGASPFQLVGHYSPTIVEYLIVVGLLCLTALAIAWGYHAFRVGESIESEVPHVKSS